MSRLADRKAPRWRMSIENGAMIARCLFCAREPPIAGAPMEKGKERVIETIKAGLLAHRDAAHPGALFLGGAD